MPPASRVGDLALGHGSYIPTPAIQGSPNVITGSSPQHRQGDSIMPHPSPSPAPPHPRSASAGSGTVLTNSKPTVRIGDAVGCGGMLVQGFPTVIVGG